MLENKTRKHISILLNGSKKITIIAAQMNNTGVIFVRMCNTAGAVGLMLQYYCSTASTANFTAVKKCDKTFLTEIVFKIAQLCVFDVL